MDQQQQRGIPDNIYTRFESAQAYMIWYLWWKSFQSWDTFIVSVSTETGQSTRANVAAAQAVYTQRMYTLLLPLLQTSTTIDIYAQLLTTIFECSWLMHTRGRLGYDDMQSIHKLICEFSTLADITTHFSHTLQLLESEMQQKYARREAAFVITSTTTTKAGLEDTMELHTRRTFILGSIFFMALAQQGKSENLKNLSVDIFQLATSTVRHEMFIESDAARQLYDAHLQQALWIPSERTYNNHLRLFPDQDKQWHIDAGLVAAPPTIPEKADLVEKSMANIKNDMEEIANLMQTTQVKIMKASAGKEIKKSRRRGVQGGIQAIISEDGLGNVELLATKVVAGSLPTDAPKIVTTSLTASPRHVRAFSSAAAIPVSPKKSSLLRQNPEAKMPLGQTTNESEMDSKKSGWIVASPRKTSSSSTPNLPTIPLEFFTGAVVIAKRQHFVATLINNPISLYAYCTSFVDRTTQHLIKSHKSIHMDGMWSFLAQTVGNPNCAFNMAAHVWTIHKTMASILSMVLPAILMTDTDVVELLVELAENVTAHPRYMDRITEAAKRLIPQWFIYMESSQKGINSTRWTDTEESDHLCQTISYLELFISEFAQKEMEWLEHEAAVAQQQPFGERKKFRACGEECKKVRVEMIHKLYDLLKLTTAATNNEADNTHTSNDSENMSSTTTTTSSNGKLH